MEGELLTLEAVAQRLGVSPVRPNHGRRGRKPLHRAHELEGEGRRRERSPEMRFATAAQVNKLAAAVQQRYRALVLVAAYGGLRWGELVNLRRRGVWLPAIKAAGLEGLRFHDLRHTAATLAVVAGATTRELMARMGQSTATMAIRYQHVMEGRDAAIAASLDRLIQSSDGAKPNGTHVARRRGKSRKRPADTASDQRE